jgi:hypothetical protein
MDKSSEEGKWLSKFYGLSFLPPEDVENSFTTGNCSFSISHLRGAKIESMARLFIVACIFFFTSTKRKMFG